MYLVLSSFVSCAFIIRFNKALSIPKIGTFYFKIFIVLALTLLIHFELIFLIWYKEEVEPYYFVGEYSIVPAIFTENTGGFFLPRTSWCPFQLSIDHSGNGCIWTLNSIMFNCVPVVMPILRHFNYYSFAEILKSGRLNTPTLNLPSSKSASLFYFNHLKFKLKKSFW